MMQTPVGLDKYRVVVCWRSPFLALLLAAVLSGCSGAATQQTAPSPLATVAATPLASPQMSEWLSFDAANRTATLTIVANALARSFGSRMPKRCTFIPSKAAALSTFLAPPS